jgi:hypothetical protein
MLQDQKLKKTLSSRTSLQPSRENIGTVLQNVKFEIVQLFFYFWGASLVFLDPDTDLPESGSNPEQTMAI